MQLGYVIHYVPDVPATLAFYGRAFGLPTRFVAPGDQYGGLETGATALAFAAESLIESQGVGFAPAAPAASLRAWKRGRWRRMSPQPTRRQSLRARCQ